MAQHSSRLDTLTNVVVLVSCVVAAATFVRLWLVRGTAPQPPRGPSLAVGDTLHRVSGLESQSRPGANRVVLALSQRCPHCEDMLPFISKLTGSGGRFEVIVVTNDEVDAMQEGLAAAKVHADRVVSPVPRPLGIRAFPTILLIGRNDAVLGVWVGRPDPATELDIELALNGVGPAPRPAE